MKTNTPYFLSIVVLLHIFQICLIFYSFHLRSIGYPDNQLEKMGNIVIIFQYAGLISYAAQKGFFLKKKPATWFLALYLLFLIISFAILSYSIYLRSI